MEILCLPILNLGMSGVGPGRGPVVLTIGYTSTQFVFKFKLPSTKSVVLHWGDGNIETVVGQDATLITKTSAYSGAGTYTFYLTGDVTDLTYIEIRNQSFVSGNISSWSNIPNLERIYASVTGVTGDISGFAVLTSLTHIHLHLTSVSGNIDGFSALTSISQIYLTSTNVEGDASVLSTMTSASVIAVGDTALTFDNTPSWTNNSCVINLNDCALTSTMVNSAIASLSTCTNCTINVAGTNDHRTSASNDDLNTLLANGNTITLNDVLGSELYTLLNAANDNATEAITAFADYASTIDGGTQVTQANDISEMLPKDVRPIKTAVTSFADYASTILGATRVNSGFDLLGFIPQGADVIVNGGFDTDTDWNKGTGWSIGSGVASASAATSNLYQTNAVEEGKYYVLTYTISNYSAGSVRIRCGSGDGGLGTNRSANGTYTEILRCETATSVYIDGVTAFTGDIDDVIVKELQVVGSDLVTNGGFATDTDWTKGTGWSIGSGVASCDGSQTDYSNFYQPSIFTTGKYYICKLTVSNYSAGVLNIRFGNLGGVGSVSSNISANGTYSFIGWCNGNTTLFLIANSTFVADIDNVSVHELTLPIHIENSTNYSQNVVGQNYHYLIPIDENDFAIPKTYAAESIVSQQIATNLINGSFTNWVDDDPVGWTVSGESGSDPMVTEVSGKCRLYTSSADIGLIKSSVITGGKYYLLSLEITDSTSGNLLIQDNLVNTIALNVTGVGVHSYVFRAETGATGLKIKRQSGATDITIDNVSLTELQVVGSDLVTNGTFATDTDWTKQPSWTIASGVAHYDGSNDSDYILQATTVLTNQVALIKFTVSNWTGTGTARVQLGAVPFTFTANGTYTVLIKALADSPNLIFRGNTTHTYDLDNVSLHKLTATKAIAGSTNYTGTHYVLPETGADLDSFIIPVDYVAEAIVAQKITGEYNATTGFIEGNNGVVDVVNSPVNIGGYAIKIDSNITPTQGAYVALDMQSAPFSISNGEVVRIAYTRRHIGINGTWLTSLSVSGGAVTNQIENILITDTTYETVVFYWVHDSNHRYFSCREGSGSNDGGIYVDSISVKKVTFP